MKKQSIRLQREFAKQRQFADYTIDGPIDYETYESQKFKILFYLKETYGYQGCNETIIGNMFDDWIDHRIITNTRETLLAYNILKSYEDKIKPKSEQEFKSVFHNNKILKQTAKRIAHVNIKKNSGESKSDDNLIRLASRENSKLLKKQIELYNPDLIITAGTVCWHSLIYDLNIFDSNLDLEKPEIIKTNNIYLCHFSHPASSGFNAFEHYNLIMKFLKI